MCILIWIKSQSYVALVPLTHKWGPYSANLLSMALVAFLNYS
jgi:hypothetical protein